MLCLIIFRMLAETRRYKEQIIITTAAVWKSILVGPGLTVAGDDVIMTS